jgi:hypothetical protein
MTQHQVPPYERGDEHPLPPYDDEKGAEGAIQENPISRSSNVAGEGGYHDSAVDTDGVPPTDTDAESPLGVGESITTRGEEAGADEAGRHDEGTKGASERPYGTSDERDSSGVNPQGPIDDESPNLQRGDQGG